MQRNHVSRKAAITLLKKIDELKAKNEKSILERHKPGTHYVWLDGKLSADGMSEVSSATLAELRGVLQFYAEGAK